jgi:ABC-type multidrug transport system fused ATPase/permease subunit
VYGRLKQRQEWAFFAALTKADRQLGLTWWVVLVLRGLLPAAFAITTGAVIGALQHHHSATVPVVVAGVTFLVLQAITPVHQAISQNLGERVAAWLFDRLAAACVTPPGIAHLENPELTGDLTVAREFDAGMTGPPMRLNVEFIGTGLVDMASGLASSVILFAYRWWAAPLLIVAWTATHWMLRESGVWFDRNTDEVRLAQRHADYSYRLAVDPPAAKELRLFGLAGWVLERFIEQRRRLFELQYRATRLRERSVLGCLAIVLTANGVVFAMLAYDASHGHLALSRLVVFAQAAVGASLIAFGGLNWALDGAAAPVAAVLRLEEAMAPTGALAHGHRSAAGLPQQAIRMRGLTFSYPGSTQPVLDGVDLEIPAGTSLAVVGVNGAGKTTLAKLLCRLYDPTGGQIEVDGIDMRELDVDAWRRQVTAVFQDFARFELSLRENVSPDGMASDDDIRRALQLAGADTLADLETPLAKGYAGGTDLSGGQWQRVALARAICGVQTGARLVLLDEPTAQLDVRGEARIFEQLLAATRDVTTVLVSHRFSTVRHADRICVIENGRVAELGSHDELMAASGRYRTMFELQAQRFQAGEDEEGQVYEVLT